jgi:hypothetical protein
VARTIGQAMHVTSARYPDVGCWYSTDVELSGMLLVDLLIRPIPFVDRLALAPEEGCSLERYVALGVVARLIK